MTKFVADFLEKTLIPGKLYTSGMFTSAKELIKHIKCNYFLCIKTERMSYKEFYSKPNSAPVRQVPNKLLSLEGLCVSILFGTEPKIRHYFIWDSFGENDHVFDNLQRYDPNKKLFHPVQPHGA